MTEPSEPRPAPGPPRPGPAPAAADRSDAPAPPAGGAEAADEAGAPFADLDRRPVAEHVAEFEAEHARLERELGTIDRL
ncbi:hypothetical protein [Blastococcus sp. PRF04-17]|uniref:hypothetical protein n=1 Tax=Blastococcus sp. PRF04-17 TaxID=2933797 RepID=UPI001FF489A1|nr:hypothetical protein [Blastococcus sp. PRF04-17]UOY02655.1 hypothetical protein MVA48_04625 [Blastococcus sp. PRF04-17]